MRISVVIPTYNRQHTVCRAIDSVLAQSLQPLEILVVDDGSTDQTVSIITERYRDRIHVIECDSNKGVSAARNLAIHHSRGDWLAFLDSDDEWLPGKLERQATQLQHSPHVLCHTDEIWIRNGTRVNPMKKHTKRGGNIFHHCLPMCVVSPSSVVIDKTVLIDAGGFDESLPACEDYDLWLKLTAQAPVLYIDEQLLVKYGGHEDQLSRKYWGMDRFRVQSLVNLLQRSVLTHHQRELAMNMLQQKLKILRKGALKHNNESLIQYCDEVLRHLPHSNPGLQ